MGACCAGRTRQLPARLVVLSPSSVESPNVQDEITFALEEKKTVIPVFHRDCKVLLPGMKRLLESRASALSQSALRAQSYPAVIQRLGEPVKRGWMTTGSVETSGPSGHADLAIPLSGPKGKGTLYAVASKRAGQWILQTLQLKVEGERSALDLLAGSSSQSVAGWAVGFNVILRTDDGGQSWKPHTSGTTYILYSVTFVSPQSGWAVGLGGTILHTEDGGNSWKPQTSGTTEWLTSVAFAPLR